MNLYLISQTVNNDYDTYDSAVVCAENEEDAKMIHPGGEEGWSSHRKFYNPWCAVEEVRCKLIGSAMDDQERGVVCASFNGG
jgi:hypothetical protein